MLESGSDLLPFVGSEDQNSAGTTSRVNLFVHAADIHSNTEHGHPVADV
jgi:hypothetical protein